MTLKEREIFSQVETADVHLGADARRGLAQREDGNVLSSVQPVYGQFSGGRPLHHGHVVLTEKHTHTGIIILQDFSTNGCVNDGSLRHKYKKRSDSKNLYSLTVHNVKLLMISHRDIRAEYNEPQQKRKTD